MCMSWRRAATVSGWNSAVGEKGDKRVMAAALKRNLELMGQDSSCTPSQREW